MGRPGVRDTAHSTREDRAVAERVLEELARRRMSRASLAAAARLSLSTIEKILSGRRAMTLATIVRLEDALQVRLRGVDAEAKTVRVSPGCAPDELGGYARAAVSWLEGRYLTLRPSFSGAGAVYAYRTDISWSSDRSVLTFKEAERLDTDFAQFGDVAVPHQSGYIYLVTNRHGQHRLAVLARPTITGDMHGILTTLQAGRGAHLSPVAMPIAMTPLKAGADAEFGRIAAGHRCHRTYSALLRRTIGDHFAKFLVE